MEKKYKLTDETIKCYGRTLYRIEALREFSGIRIGQKGGFVESEDNLSHNGLCWICDNAMVYDKAVVSEDARVYHNAEVYGNARVCGNVLIRDYAEVRNNAIVFDNASINSHSIICNDAQVFGNTYITDNATIRDNAKVYGKACIKGYATIADNAEVYGYTLVGGTSNILGQSRVYKNASIQGNAIIYNAEIKCNSDYIVFKNWWSSGRYFTWTRSNNMWRVGCFYGTGEELIAKAYKDSELSGREYKRIVKYVESITSL